MITHLTERQRARFGEFADKWTAIGLSTDPANRKKAETGVRMAYKAAGLKPPKQIIWFDSPLAMCATHALLAHLDKDNAGRILGPIFKMGMAHKVAAEADRGVTTPTISRILNEIVAMIHDVDLRTTGVAGLRQKASMGIADLRLTEYINAWENLGGAPSSVLRRIAFMLESELKSGDYHTGLNAMDQVVYKILTGVQQTQRVTVNQAVSNKIEPATHPVFNAVYDTVLQMGRGVLKNQLHVVLDDSNGVRPWHVTDGAIHYDDVASDHAANLGPGP